VRTDEIMSTTNYYLTEGVLSDKKLVRLLTLLKISFLNGREAKLLLKKKAASLNELLTDCESLRRKWHREETTAGKAGTTTMSIASKERWLGEANTYELCANGLDTAIRKARGQA
jgi:hypothetical protein